MLQELLYGWINVLTKPSVDAFGDEKSKADPLKTVLGLAIAGFVGGLVSIRIADPAMAILIDLARSIFFTAIQFFIVSFVLYMIAKLFGGSGDFAEQSYLLSLFVVPLSLIIAVSGKVEFGAVGLDPLKEVGMVQFIQILAIAYGALLLIFALQAAHDLLASDVIRVLGVALLGWAILVVVGFFVTGVENVITTNVYYMWGEREKLLDLTLQHAWLVLFSMAIAIVLGVIMGILITLPPRRPYLSHLLLLLPLALLILLYLGSGGTFGEAIADWLKDTLPRPQGMSLIGIVLILLLYLLFVLGERAAEPMLYAAGIMLTIPSIALFGLFIPLFGIGFLNVAVALILYAQLPILRNTYTGIKNVSPAIIEAGRGMGMTEWQLLFKVKLPMTVPVIMAGVRVSVVMIVGIAAIGTLIGVDNLGDFIFDGLSRISDRMVLAGAVGVSIFAILVDYLLGWAQTFLTPAGLREERV